MEKIYKIIEVILEEMGYLIFEKDGNDFDIRDYVGDSLQFIDFIVRIEEKLKFELSDDFLDYDLLSSANGFSNKVFSFLEDNYKN
ncbi:MAG: acyl carrier protein [Oscillospiraceae bacterium]|nr:acyl carrier protein [Oscillospiraceae bacterium]